MTINELRQQMPLSTELRPAKIQDNSNPFGDVLSGFVKSVNDNSLKSSQLTEDFISGKNVEIHEVMIAGEKAKTSLDLLMEIRNKSIDMYRELTRMQ